MVDDEPDVADIVAIVLRKAAHEVDIVDSGAAALDRLERDRYDLIVCDLVMPGVNGMAVFEAVQRLPAPRPRMLFLSGYYDAGGYEDFLERTKVPVVPKPFDFVALPEAVARVLGPAS